MEESWKRVLAKEFEQPYMAKLRAFLMEEKGKGKILFPPGSQIFHAFDATPFDRVKVVILGQDPYIGPGQAHGLCFSVPQGIPAPPSLVNIYKELQSDMGIPPAPHGNLESWTEQGVFLLNAVLTVEAGLSASHQKRGWETFTDAVISTLNEQRQNLVFILWGSYAQKKGQHIDRKRHLVLQSVHPSPLSVYRGFYGSKPFSQTNAYLQKTGQTPISWQLP